MLLLSIPVVVNTSESNIKLVSNILFSTITSETYGSSGEDSSSKYVK